MDYLGSKTASGAAQAIIAQFPPHDVYIETHLGTGAIMRRKPPAARHIGIEIDEKTIEDFPPPENCQLVHGDCIAFLNKYNFKAAGRCLIYLDPPYLLSTRTSTKRYRNDYSELDHIHLLDTIKDIEAMAIISGYPSKLYDEKLEGWRKIEFQVMTRGGPRTECIWMNYPAAAVQWSTFAGQNFTDRQRIKRKAERWRANYAKLPQGERMAILAAIMKVDL